MFFHCLQLPCCRLCFVCPVFLSVLILFMLPINSSRTCSVGPNFQSYLNFSLIFTLILFTHQIQLLFVGVDGFLFLCFSPNWLFRLSRIFFSSLPGLIANNTSKALPFRLWEIYSLHLASFFFSP